MKKYIIGLLALFLTGCETTYYTMNDGLDALLGKDISTAFRVIGYPDSSFEVAGKTVCIWSNSSVENIVVEKPPTLPIIPRDGLYVPGLLGPRIPLAQRRLMMLAPEEEIVPVHNQGEIKIIANSSNKIIDWEYSGNREGLEKYSDPLRRYASEVQ